MLRATAWTAFHSSPVRCSEGETMKRIEKRAYGKINLSLDVVGKREDGYHLVRMVMQTVGISDTLEIVQAQHGEVHLKVLGSDITAGPDNLVCRAAQAMREAFDLRDGFDITLEKHIPAAAGMAGGSADAAAVLTGIRDMYSLWADNTRLREIALPLGADIPYCVEGGTALCEGIGEVLTPLPDWLQCELVDGGSHPAPGSSDNGKALRKCPGAEDGERLSGDRGAGGASEGRGRPECGDDGERSHGLWHL